MSERICAVEGCINISRINKVINHITKRGILCEKHHRQKHPRTIKWWKNGNNFNKCIMCGWIGPCDTHRIDEQGRYIKSNCISVCPNCHRLHHRGIVLIDKFKKSDII